MSVLKLNVGGGDAAIEGYRTVDRKNGDEAFPLTLDGRPVESNSVDALRASHVLEHFSHRQSMDVLAEWVRVLKPGGTIRVAVPNFAFIAGQYAAGNRDPLLMLYLFGGHVDADDHHGAGFDEPGLRHAMRSLGLRKVRRWKSEIEDCAALHVSLNLEGTKPLRPDVEKVQAVMSVPRIGWTDNFACTTNVMAQLGIPVYVGRGVFWGQVVTMGIETALAAGMKYVLTIDYDSIYSTYEVEELYRLMEANPHADAICPMQLRRDSDEPLFTMKDGNGAQRQSVCADELAADLTPISTGHFGLTILRADAFLKLPLPWFHSQPGADGRWGDGHVDEDISFWKNWTEAGRTLFSAPLNVGHLQLVPTWIGWDLKPLYQSIRDYQLNGPPHGAIG